MWMLSLVLLTATPAQSAEPPSIAVMPVQIEASAAEMPSGIFDDAVLAAVQSHTGARVTGRDDLNAMLNLDKQKELLGCDSTVCFAEIGGALGVGKMVTMKVAFIDGQWVCTSKLIDLTSASVEARSTDFVHGGATELLSALPGIVAKLFGPTHEGPAPVENTESTEAPRSEAPRIGTLASREMPQDASWYWELSFGLGAIYAEAKSPTLSYSLESVGPSLAGRLSLRSPLSEQLGVDIGMNAVVGSGLFADFFGAAPHLVGDVSFRIGPFTQRFPAYFGIGPWIGIMSFFGKNVDVPDNKIVDLRLAFGGGAAIGAMLGGGDYDLQIRGFAGTDVFLSRAQVSVITAFGWRL